MSDELQQVSQDAAAIIRKDLEQVRVHLLAAQELTDGIRNVPMVVNGTKEGLKSLSAKIGEADDMMPKIFGLVLKTYGEPPEEDGDVPATLTEVIANSEQSAADPVLWDGEER